MEISESNRINMQMLINEHSLDPFLLTSQQLFDSAIQMLNSYDLIAKYRIPIGSLHKFLILLSHTYRADISFHNFYHAFGTMHLTYSILRRGADQFLSRLDILALLLAAICHDSGHPGNDNAFEVATCSALATEYGDDMVLERHHTRMTLELLQRWDAEDGLLSGLLPAEKKRLRSLVIAAIMGTNMSLHSKCVKEVQHRADAKAAGGAAYCSDEESVLALAHHVVHAADIGAQTQGYAVAYKWSRRLQVEFSGQVDRERALGLPVTAFMDGLEDEARLLRSQAGFVQHVAGPLWAALAGCFPALAPAWDSLQDTGSRYLARAAELEQNM